MKTLWNDLIESIEFVKDKEKYLIAMAFRQNKNTTKEPSIDFYEAELDDLMPTFIAKGIREVLAPNNS